MKFVLRGENNVKVGISEGANGYEELSSAWQNIQSALAILKKVGYVSIGDITVSLRKYDDGREELVGFDWKKDYDEFRIPIPKGGETVEIRAVSVFLKAGEYARLVPSAYEEQKQKTLSQVNERLKSLYDFAYENGLNPKDIILYYDTKTKQEVSLEDLVNGGLEKLGDNLRDIEVVDRNISTAKRVLEKHLENIQSKTASPNL